MILRDVRVRRLGLVYGVAVALVLAPLSPNIAAAEHAITRTNAATAGRTEDPPSGPTSTRAPNVLPPITNSKFKVMAASPRGEPTAGLTGLVGTNGLILVFAGGTVLPTSSVGVVIAATGMIFASVCAVGALATPAVVRLWDYYYVGMRPATTP
jgi:hypothetical protein